ncbi:transposase [Streptomyces sp. 11x1]|uniref:RNA-guided endonuclease InsQ/TnpB family protein n=1 Tax=Streptomyces sp. 11x1 TaxID=3038642 RepID=UPI00292F8038|nr:transposase [Streptomyces sp. 11x1]WNZ09547.1 transposase [Streptomyces sp. 11x1]
MSVSVTLMGDVGRSRAREGNGVSRFVAMPRFRMYPSPAQAEQMLTHCAHARYVWNLAVEQHTYWRPGRRSAPGFAEQCRQLTEARRENAWLGEGNADVQQQALKDFARAKSARFTSGFGEPTWRRKHVHEGFRGIGTDRVPEYEADGSPKLNAKTGRQVMGRSVVVQRLNRRWAQVRVPGRGWVRFRLSAEGKGAKLPAAKTFRVTFRNGQWHIAFAVIPDPVEGPGTDTVIGIDRGVTITAALSDGRRLNCPSSPSRNAPGSASTSGARPERPKAALPRRPSMRSWPG